MGYVLEQAVRHGSHENMTSTSAWSYSIKSMPKTNRNTLHITVQAHQSMSGLYFSWPVLGFTISLFFKYFYLIDYIQFHNLCWSCIEYITKLRAFNHYFISIGKNNPILFLFSYQYFDKTWFWWTNFILYVQRWYIYYSNSSNWHSIEIWWTALEQILKPL